MGSAVLPPFIDRDESSREGLYDVFFFVLVKLIKCLGKASREAVI